MTIQVTGKNIGAGEAFQNYVTDKIDDVLDKYIGPELSGHVRVEKSKVGFRTDCSLRLRTGLLVEAHGEGVDAYASADAAIERLAKRVRRYKRRLKDHHHGAGASAEESRTTGLNEYVVQVEEEDDTQPIADSPVIVAESEGLLTEMTVSEAVMQLDLTDKAFLLFRNAAHGRISVVHRRPDGNIGWIDPQADTRSSAKATVAGRGEPSKANGSDGVR
jgi:ribosomal subunit interface protein